VYLEYYGLKEPPFSITPNPRFLFFSAKHREAFNHLLYGIRERKGFVQLTGEVGSGKTTLCRALLDELGNNYSTALILNPILDPDGLVRNIAMELGLNAKGMDRFEMIAEINYFLLSQLEQGRDTVLLIDEAQNLTPELLEQVRLLSNLETDDRKLLQIVLMGQPELRDRLNDPALRQLRQRITVRYHLNPLRHGEVGNTFTTASACRAPTARPTSRGRHSGGSIVTRAGFPAWSMPFVTNACLPGTSSNATGSISGWSDAPSANLKETSPHEPH